MTIMNAMARARTRRLRGNEVLRRMVRETRLSRDALVYPLFVREGRGIEEALPSLPGQTRYSPDTVAKGIDAALNAGVRSFMLFGIPETKDENGGGAYDENGAFHCEIWFGCTSCFEANSLSGTASRSASKTTFTLNESSYVLRTD